MTLSNKNNFRAQYTKKINNKKYFESSDHLLKQAYEYFEWCNNNCWLKQEVVKSGSSVGTIIHVPVPRPYSLNGLCAYMGCSRKRFEELRNDCDKDFRDVIERIETIIEAQHFEGTAIGIFNSSVCPTKAVASKPNREDMDKLIFRIEVMDGKTGEELEKLQVKLK